MRVALLGDIHGNSFALAAVLSAASALRVDKLLITGDFVGYYFWPKEVLEMLNDWDFEAVRGNHEDMLASALNYPETLAQVNAKYGSGLSTALETLTTTQIDWLCHLPHPKSFNFDGRRLLLCHGSPWDINQYVYPDAGDDLLERCAEPGYDWVVMGHTHYPMVERVGKTVLINPGSVGQARNRMPGAHWGLLDTESGEISLLTSPYETSPVVASAFQRHPELTYLVNAILGKR